MKTLNIKGKEYVEVNERLKYFRANYPEYALESEIIQLGNGIVTIKATIKDENGRVLATGLAQEKESSSFINKTSYVENCETSAWGRALGNFGIGIDTSVASAEEVLNASLNQEVKPIQKKTSKETITEDDKGLIAGCMTCKTVEELNEYYKEIAPMLSSAEAKKLLVQRCKERKENL